MSQIFLWQCLSGLEMSRMVMYVRIRYGYNFYLETYASESAIVKSGTTVVINAGPVTKITQVTNR